MNPVSAETLEKLKAQVAQATEAPDFCKQVIFHLIEASHGLTLSVRVETTNGALGRTMGFGIHDMNSDTSQTRLGHWMSRNRIKPDLTGDCSKRDPKSRKPVWGAQLAVQGTQPRLTDFVPKEIRGISLPETGIGERQWIARILQEMPQHLPDELWQAPRHGTFALLEEEMGRTERNFKSGVPLNECLDLTLFGVTPLKAQACHAIIKVSEDKGALETNLPLIARIVLDPESEQKMLQGILKTAGRKKR